MAIYIVTDQHGRERFNGTLGECNRVLFANGRNKLTGGHAWSIKFLQYR